MAFVAKMIVETVTLDQWGDSINMRAVTGGSAEDNSFAKATPSADLTIRIDNPDLRGKVKPGQVFYLNFSEAK